MREADPFRRRRILIVDDDASSRSLLALAVTDEGYRVHQAGNGDEAVDLLREHTFDLVIAELNLEGKDGFQIVAEMRRQPAPISLIVTVRTGWMPAEFCRRMAQQLGACHILARPFPPRQLVAAVRSVLG